MRDPIFPKHNNILNVILRVGLWFVRSLLLSNVSREVVSHVPSAQV